MTFRYISLLVCSICLAASAFSHAGAQSLSGHKVEAQYGDWQMVCKPQVGGSSRKICGLVQNVMAEDRTNVGLVIQFQEYANKARAIRVFAPLGVLLPRGLRVKIDNKDICFTPDGQAPPQAKQCAPFPFLRCTPDACIAQIAVNQDVLKKLSSGKSAVFIVYQTEESGIGIPISLAGFAKALGQLSGSAR